MAIVSGRGLVLGTAAACALGVTIFDRAPRVAETVPTAASASAARALLERVRDAGSGFHPITVDADEIAAVGDLGARAAGLARAETAIDNGAIVSRVSLPVPLGLWINAQANVAPDESGAAVVSGMVGALPIPPWLAGIGVWAVRRWYSNSEQELPAIDELVRGLDVKPETVTAQIRVPSGGAALASLGSNALPAIDGAMVGASYCRLVAAQRDQGIADLSALSRAAFSDGARDAGSNRATLLAMAMVAVSPKVARLAGPGTEAAARCGTAEPVTLHGRADLAKHWALSAALAASFGPDASGIAGLWKELADSAVGGSGFSYVDLAADRAGVAAGDRASRAGSAARVAKWLATASEADLLPISQLALSEGMSEAAFKRRYGAIDGARHKAAVARIDRVIARKMPA